MNVTTGMTVSSERSRLEKLAVNTIRTLARDAVQAANSAHPGTSISMAPVAYCLWQRFLRFDPNDPIWPNRDRFVLSAGHASMLRYSLLHLTGVKAVNAKYERLGELSLKLDDIKRFRQQHRHGNVWCVGAAQGTAKEVRLHCRARVRHGQGTTGAEQLEYSACCQD